MSFQVLYFFQSYACIVFVEGYILSNLNPISILFLFLLISSLVSVLIPEPNNKNPKGYTYEPMNENLTIRT